jgi:hypothetical protein
VLNLTWNEIVFGGFLFLLVFFVGYLPRLGDAIGDFLHGYRTAGVNDKPRPVDAGVMGKAEDKQDPTR